MTLLVHDEATDESDEAFALYFREDPQVAWDFLGVGAPVETDPGDPATISSLAPRNSEGVAAAISLPDHLSSRTGSDHHHLDLAPAPSARSLGPQNLAFFLNCLLNCRPDEGPRRLVKNIPQRSRERQLRPTPELSPTQWYPALATLRPRLFGCESMPMRSRPRQRGRMGM